jgi:hypothetical protein
MQVSEHVTLRSKQDLSNIIVGALPSDPRLVFQDASRGRVNLFRRTAGESKITLQTH